VKLYDILFFEGRQVLILSDIGFISKGDEKFVSLFTNIVEQVKLEVL